MESCWIIMLASILQLSIQYGGAFWSFWLVKLQNSWQFMWSSTYIIWRWMKSWGLTPKTSHQKEMRHNFKLALRDKISNSQRINSIILLNFSRRKIYLPRKKRFSANKIHWASSEQFLIIPSTLRRINLSLLNLWRKEEQTKSKCPNPKNKKSWIDQTIYIVQTNFNATKLWWILTPFWVLRKVLKPMILSPSKMLPENKYKITYQEIRLRKLKWAVIQTEEELFF